MPSKYEFKRMAYKTAKTAARAAVGYALKSRKRQRTQTASGPRRTYRRRPQYFKPYDKPLNKKKVRSKMKKICNFIKQMEATHLHRQREVGTVRAVGVARVNYVNSTAGTITEIESAMANLAYFDPSINDIVALNATVGSYERDMMLSITRKIKIKNNYRVPAHVELWCCSPKVDTNLNPITVFTNSLVDQGNPSPTSPLTQFKDSDDLKNMWTMKLCARKTLMPAACMYSSKFTGKFNYSINTADQHNLTYQKKNKGHAWVIVIKGELGHDAVIATEIGLTSCGIDYMIDNEYHFTYDGGKAMHRVSQVDNSTSTFTNAGLQSEKPLTAQQTYTT